MKIACLTFIFISLSTFSFTQNIGYEVLGTYKRSVKKEVLNHAKTIGDITPKYPSDWINNDDYVSSTLVANFASDSIIASGVNDSLTVDQKNLLTSSIVGTDLKFRIDYKNKNSVTEEISVRTIEFGLTIVPTIEAEYKEGYDRLRAYLFENAIEKITQISKNNFERAVIRFTVDKEGTIINPQISISSEDKEIDVLLLRAVHLMPQWNPAVNNNGENINQDFELNVGYLIGC